MGESKARYQDTRPRAAGDAGGGRRPQVRVPPVVWRSAAILLTAAYPYVRLRGAAVANPVDSGVAPFGWARFSMWTAVGLAIASVVYGACRLLGVERDRAAAVAVVTLLITFAWSPFVALGDLVAGWGPVASAAVGMTAGLAVLALAVTLTLRLAPGVTFLRVVALIAGSLLVVSGWSFWTAGAGDESSTSGTPMAPGEPDAAATPDIYLIVLDGYGSPTALERYADYDATSFVRMLRGEGFEVTDGIESLYANTIMSVGTMLALDDVFDDGVISRGDRLAALSLMSGHSPLEARLREAGYEIVHVTNGWGLVACDTDVVSCVRGSWFNEYDWAIAQSTPLASLPGGIVHPWVSGSLRQFDVLSEFVERPSDTPRFVLAHVLVPHPPFHLSPDCAFRTGVERAGYGHAREGVATGDRMNWHADQIDCVGGLVASFAEQVPEDAMVLVTGDHGTAFRRQMDREPGTWDADDIDERFGVFWAMRLPEECGPPAQAPTNVVSGVRAAAACVLGDGMVPVGDSRRVVEWLDDGEALITSVG